jgi:hypothetical protein
MNKLRFSALTLFPILALALGAACTGSDTQSSKPPGDPGAKVTASLNPTQQQDLAAIQAEVAACKAQSTADFLAAHALPQATSLAYDPSAALGLPAIQASALSLSTDEQTALKKNGFVISDRRAYPSFTYGYQAIYQQDLPLYISADSILHTVHKSFDDMLKGVEEGWLVPELGDLLDGMRASLQAGSASALGSQAVTDADFYLAVASGLLGGAKAPVAGAAAADVDAFVTSAEAASGTGEVSLFGVTRTVDFSQFKPRGHYVDDPTLQKYFRAMMWLGQIDFRFLEAQPDLTLRFHRRQLVGAYALGTVLDAAAKGRWQRIHDTIAGFVGVPDSMTVPELDKLLADLGVSSAAGLSGLSDQKITDAIIAGGYGQQKISGHIMVNGLGAGTMPLSSTFLLFGQAYVVDSHVFSNVVYDRAGGGSIQRMMPDPLDVSFAALNNDQAASLLAPQLQQYGYAPDLCSMRAIVSGSAPEFWEGSLYNLWLSSLRTLSPGSEVADPATAGMPTLTGTEAWGRRLANTQLASWAELRHDTILYAKQSYTGGDACEFPDAYVDPYPQFWASLSTYAQHGKAILGGLSLTADQLAWYGGYFDRLDAAAQKLRAMAEQERTGTPFTTEQMAWINQAVVVQQICGGASATGWFPELYLLSDGAIDFDPTIADVHTQPTDPGGVPVGKVLHVATGRPRMMVVTADTCSGPRAYVGLASSYFEKITKDYQRLDDEAWADDINQHGHPADVPWMADVVVR